LAPGDRNAPAAPKSRLRYAAQDGTKKWPSQASRFAGRARAIRGRPRRKGAADGDRNTQGPGRQGVDAFCQEVSPTPGDPHRDPRERRRGARAPWCEGPTAGPRRACCGRDPGAPPRSLSWTRCISATLAGRQVPTESSSKRSTCAIACQEQATARTRAPLRSGNCESGGNERETRHGRSARPRSAYAGPCQENLGCAAAPRPTRAYVAGRARNHATNSPGRSEAGWPRRTPAPSSRLAS
jgi:hypothetical protein